MLYLLITIAQQATIGSLMLEHYCQPAVVSSDISRPNAEGESKQPEH